VEQIDTCDIGYQAILDSVKEFVPDVRVCANTKKLPITFKNPYALYTLAFYNLIITRPFNQ